MPLVDGHGPYGPFADHQPETVVYRFGCGQGEVEEEFAGLIGVVLDDIVTGKFNPIGRIPEQAFAAVIER